MLKFNELIFWRVNAIGLLLVIVGFLGSETYNDYKDRAAIEHMGFTGTIKQPERVYAAKLNDEPVTLTVYNTDNGSLAVEMHE